MEENNTITKEIKFKIPTEEFIKDILEFEMPDMANEELRSLDEFIKIDLKQKKI